MRFIKGDSLKDAIAQFHHPKPRGESASPAGPADFHSLEFGKPSPLTHDLLALTYLGLGEKEQAKEALAQAAPAKDAPWEDVYLQRLLRPEVDAALAKAEGK